MIKTAPSGGVLIRADGSWSVVAGQMGLRELQRELGGYVQAVPVEWDDDGSARTTLWCNDDGMSIGLPRNVKATRLWWTLNPEMANRDILLGTVLFTGAVEESGYGPLPQDVYDRWLRLCDA